MTRRDQIELFFAAILIGGVIGFTFRLLVEAL